MTVIKEAARGGMVHYFCDGDPYHFDAWVGEKDKTLAFLIEEEHKEDLELIKEEVFSKFIEEGYGVTVTTLRGAPGR